MGRPLFLPQIYQKIICIRSNFHKTTFESWWKTPVTQEGKPISLIWGRTKYKDEKRNKAFSDRDPSSQRESWRKRSFHKLGNPLTNGVSGELWDFRWQHNQQQEQKITTEFLLNYLRKSGSHALVCLQQVGAGCGGAGGIIGPYGGWRPWGHSEGTNVTKQLKPREWQRDKEKQRPSPLEGSKAALWPLVHSQTKACALVNTKGEQAGSRLRHSPGGKRGMCATPRVGTQGAIAISVPETAAPIKLWTGSQSLTTSSWILEGSYLPGVSRLRLASWGDSRSAWDCTLRAHRRASVAWTWEVLETRDSPGTIPSGSAQASEQLGPGKHYHHRPWQPPCGPSTGSATHTCQWGLFAVSLPLHSTTEKASFAPSCQGGG